MQIKYTGDIFNPCESDNELSVRLLRGITEGISHGECADGEYTNTVTVDIKEK